MKHATRLSASKKTNVARLPATYAVKLTWPTHAQRRIRMSLSALHARKRDIGPSNAHGVTCKSRFNKANMTKGHKKMSKMQIEFTYTESRSYDMLKEYTKTGRLWFVSLYRKAKILYCT
ncbi:hypothetical protein B5P40_32185, partial [Bacillus sp. SRB_8]